MSHSGYVHLEFESIDKETEKAFLIMFDGEPYWIPKNQIADADDYKVGDKEGSISLTDWIAKEKGLQ